MSLDLQVTPIPSLAAGRMLIGTPTGRAAWKPHVVYLSQHGILPDTGADLTADIQALIAANTTILFDRPGDYLINGATTSGGQTFGLVIAVDNLTLQGVPGARVTRTVAGKILFPQGAAKPEGAANWGKYWIGRGAPLSTGITQYTITAAARGAMSVTTATAADAGNFAAGDDIYLRTGQTIANGSEQPDAEFNIVAAADATTGIITLRYPLAKPYDARTYPAGHPSAGSPTPLAVVNATPIVLRNVRILGLGFDVATGLASSAAMESRQIVGFEVGFCTFNNPGTMNFGTYRAGWIHDNTFHIENPADATARWWTGTDTGSSDVVFERNTFTSRATTYLHLHEGSARIIVRNNRIFSGSTGATSTPVVSIRGNAWGVTVEDNDIISAHTATSNAGIYVDGTCTGGGTIQRNRIWRVAGASGIQCGAANWEIGPRQAMLGVVRLYNDQNVGLIAGGGVGPVGVESCSNWVADNQQNPVIGTLPANSILLGIAVHVTQAFNSDGTDTLTVGYDADTDALLTALDVSATGVTMMNTSGHAREGAVKVGSYTASDLAIEAYYTNGGSAPTTGRALVTMQYLRCAAEVA